jgi:hypothetical protein
MSAYLSFTELFENLGQYVDDPMKRWKQCLRAKRGVSDTSQPGGYYKDQCYLSGAAQILLNRDSIDFYKLYSGKISLDDLNRPEINQSVDCSNLVYPIFLRDLGKYRSLLEVIAHTNSIE